MSDEGGGKSSLKVVITAIVAGVSGYYLGQVLGHDPLLLCARKEYLDLIKTVSFWDYVKKTKGEFLLIAYGVALDKMSESKAGKRDKLAPIYKLLREKQWPQFYDELVDAVIKLKGDEGSKRFFSAYGTREDEYRHRRMFILPGVLIIAGLAITLLNHLLPFFIWVFGKITPARRKRKQK